MQPELAVGLASTGVAAIAIVTSTVTNVLSLRSQKENTRMTLEAQRALASFQEDALRERAHDQDLRDKRAALYLDLLRWTEHLLNALDEMHQDGPGLPRHRWHIERDTEDLVDLYASDAVHIRFNSLRGMLFGLVEGSERMASRIVSWTEADGRIEDVKLAERSLPDWPAQRAVRDEAVQKALDLAHVIRAEAQGRQHSGYFVTYRMDRTEPESQAQTEGHTGGYIGPSEEK